MKLLHLLLKINTFLSYALVIVIALMALGGVAGGFLVFVWAFVPLVAVFSISVIIATCLFLASLVTKGEMIAAWKGVVLCLASLVFIAIDLWIGVPIIRNWLQ